MLLKTINMTLGVLVAISVGCVALLVIMAAWRALVFGEAALRQLLPS